MRRHKRIAVGSAVLLAAGAVGALEKNPTLAPLAFTVDDAKIDGTADTQNSSPLDATDLHELALELAGEWGLSENDMDMYFPPDQVSTQPPMMIVAAASPTKEKVVGACLPVKGGEPEPGEGVLFSFGGAAQGYLVRYEHKDPMDVDISRVQIKLLAVTRPPEHGQLTMIKNDPYQSTLYRPDAGYYGKDRIEATVAVGNDIVRVVYSFVVQRKDIERLQPAEDRKLCPKGLYWKISEASEEGRTVTSGRFDGMNALLTSASQSFTFGDLMGNAVGETHGTGANAQITLDDSAASYGWYIDYTPYLNDEYLPTSNPNEWIAKEGSAAYGKMDLLSVLLHEYGHALGIEHSIDPHDFMGATLAPGVRRLPSADELALMAKLVAEAKGEMPLPADPAMPDQPGAPLPTRNGTVRVARARITREGTFVDSFDSADTQLPQYEVAANPTLADPKLQTGTGWETTGKRLKGPGSHCFSSALSTLR